MKNKKTDSYVGNLNLQCTLGEIAELLKGAAKRYGKNAIINVVVRATPVHDSLELNVDLEYDQKIPKEKYK